ncbi:hypothetical protein BC831DRAFT_446598 [Entophlyctis helioformis]|nr:hypothetical protein BC831DRAFT_446598 [Entophlyctis helioformis]
MAAQDDAGTRTETGALGIQTAPHGTACDMAGRRRIASIHSLPVDVLLLVFARLDAVALCRCELVCRHWHEVIANHDRTVTHVWHHVLPTTVQGLSSHGHERHQQQSAAYFSSFDSLAAHVAQQPDETRWRPIMALPSSGWNSRGRCSVVVQDSAICIMGPSIGFRVVHLAQTRHGPSLVDRRYPIGANAQVKWLEPWVRTRWIALNECDSDYLGGFTSFWQLQDSRSSDAAVSETADTTDTTTHAMDRLVKQPVCVARFQALDGHHTGSVCGDLYACCTGWWTEDGDNDNDDGDNGDVEDIGSTPQLLWSRPMSKRVIDVVAGEVFVACLLEDATGLFVQLLHTADGSHYAFLQRASRADDRGQRDEADAVSDTTNFGHKGIQKLWMTGHGSSTDASRAPDQVGQGGNLLIMQSLGSLIVFDLAVCPPARVQQVDMGGCHMDIIPVQIQGGLMWVPSYFTKEGMALVDLARGRVLQFDVPMQASEATGGVWICSLVFVEDALLV